MLNFIQRFLSKEHLNFSQIRKDYIDFFYSLPEHQWIMKSAGKSHFDKLINHLPAKLLQSMMSDYPVIFVRSQDIEEEMKQGRKIKEGLSSVRSYSLVNKIVVFPEFQKLIFSSKRCAVAYLAHEVAHLFLEIEHLKLEHQENDTLKTEIEADKFVSDLGLMYELEDFLLMLDETLEKRLRLTYLTCHHFSKLSS